MFMSTLAVLFVTTSMHFNLPSNLLSSLCYIESSHNIAAVHEDDGGSNSVGVCQIKLSTARWLGFRGTEKQLINPKINIYYAGKYLKYQIKRYDSMTKAIIAYNIGNAKGLTNTKYSTKVIKQWRLVNEHSKARRH